MIVHVHTVVLDLQDEPELGEGMTEAADITQGGGSILTVTGSPLIPYKTMVGLSITRYRPLHS